MPPIYQPEVAADAIISASSHARREVWAGAPTVSAILAQAFAPGLLDRFIARRAYGAQQRPRSEDPQRSDNLFEPVPFDMGAHGVFDERAHDRSFHWWVSRHLRASVAGAMTVGALLFRRRSRH